MHETKVYLQLWSKAHSKTVSCKERQPTATDIELEQVLKLPLGQAQTLEFLHEVFPSRLNVRGLLQKPPRPLLTIRTGHFKTFHERPMNPTIPIQSSKQFLIDGHRHHVREAFV